MLYAAHNREQATKTEALVTAEDFIVGEKGRTFDRVAESLRKFRHFPHYEPLIQSALRCQPPATVAQLVRASLWNKKGASPETGYIPRDYEDILRRDLLFIMRSLADCAELEPTLEQDLVGEIREILLRNSRQRTYYPVIEYTRQTLPDLAQGRLGRVLETVFREVLSDRTASTQERMDAATALGYTSNPSSEVVTLLLTVLRSHREETHVRTCAARALGNLRTSTPEVITTLLTLLAGRRQSHLVRCACATALGEFGITSPEVVSALSSIVGNPRENEFVLYESATALRVLEAVPAGLVELYTSFLANARNRSPERRLSPVVLRHLGAKSAELVSLFVVVLSDSRELFSVRSEAARSLGEIGSATSEVLSTLLQVIRDKSQHYEIRDRAISALGQLMATHPNLQHLLQDISSASEEELSLTGDIRLGLARYGIATQETIASLREIMLGQNKMLALRHTAARLLGTNRDSTPETLSALHSLIANPSENKDLRFYAAATLFDLRESSPDITSIFLTELTGSSTKIHEEGAWLRLNAFVMQQGEPEEMTGEQT